MTTGPTPARLDTELVRRGLVPSRTRAAALVAQGRVRVGGAVAAKPSVAVRAEDELDVAHGDGPDYVSRAAYKLSGAFDALGQLTAAGPAVRGARCLDAGASTGGFTQVLLERGASHVVAMDVGHDQIADVIARDPRVSVREGVNVRHLSREDVDEPPTVVVADLSFISLTLVVGALRGVVDPGADLVVMVKPQFEIGRDRLGSRGVVTSVELRHEAVRTVAEAATRVGTTVRAVVPSPLPGPSGNQEYFLWLVADERHDAAPSRPVSDAVSRAVRAGTPTLVRTEDAP